jgi:hypothetical protein
MLVFLFILAKRALMINLVGGVLFLTLTCLTGLVAYGKYADCDLLGSGKITRSEQVKQNRQSLFFHFKYTVIVKINTPSIYR